MFGLVTSLSSIRANKDPPIQIFSTHVSRDFASLNAYVASLNANCVSRGSLLMAANLLAADHCMTSPTKDFTSTQFVDETN